MRIFWGLGFAGALAFLGGCGTAPVKQGGNVPVMVGMDQQRKDLETVGDSRSNAGGIQVVLEGDPLFHGRSKLTAAGSKKVDALAAVLKKYPKDRISILDFTDNSGKSGRNLKLSQRRANAVKAELVAQGIPADGLSAVGKGDTAPVAANDTDADRAKNRRVELDIAEK